MRQLSDRLRAFFAKRIPALKALSIGGLAVLAWPIPSMIRFSNPAEAVFFGRYDRLYFLMLAGYVGLTLAWGASSLWLVRWLNTERLERSRQWAQKHSRLVWIGLGLAALTGLIGEFIIGWQVQPIPGEVYDRLRHIPVVMLVAIGLGAIIGWGDVLDKVFKPPAFPAKREKWLAGLALCLLASWLLLQRGLFTTALIKDASAHLYIGQHWLRGGVPYDTVIYFHPPLRFAVSAVWALLSRIGLPPVEAARAIYWLMALGVVLAVYGIGQRLTGSTSGGAIAAGLMLHTPFITTTVFEGPNLKIGVALALTASVLLAQDRRWFWAGVASAAGAGLWLPAASGAIGIGLTALLAQESRWQAVLKVTLGGLLVGGLIGGWMLIAGTLAAFFQQSVVAAFMVAGSGGDGAGWAIWQDILNLPSLLKGWVPTAAAGLGIVIVLIRRGPGREAWLAPLAVGGMLFAITSQDVLLGLDFIALSGLLAGFEAAAVLALLDGLPARQTGRIAAAGLVLASLATMGIVTSISRNFDREAQPLTLADQKAMAADLDAALGPNDRVQAFDLMWFMVLTERDNPLPILQARPKGQASNTAAGWPEPVILEALEESQPAVVLLEGGSQVDMSQLGNQYLNAGAYDASTVRPQLVYIRRDRQAIVDALNAWPEANP